MAIVTIAIALLISLSFKFYFLPKSLENTGMNMAKKEATTFNNDMTDIESNLNEISESYRRMDAILDKMNADLIDILCEVCRQQGYNQAMEEMENK